ncbi:MAG: hypothetical protein QOF23_1275 [Solirubrobacterales bacterium]|nr:hypothetical protein [Solirubrobacterales bacterium]
MARKTATGDEAAAVAAAIARFEVEAGAVVVGQSAAGNPWQQAALVEGVGAKQTIQDPQGGARWQS